MSVATPLIENQLVGVPKQVELFDDILSDLSNDYVEKKSRCLNPNRSLFIGETFFKLEFSMRLRVI